MTATAPAILDPVTRLTRDLRAAAKHLAPAEARYLVDYYYSLQEDRIRANNQVRQMLDADGNGNKSEPSEVLQWLALNTSTLEKQIARALDAYTSDRTVSMWARSIVGIGPIISAGLLAHIDIKCAPTVGHIWSFAGLNPSVRWLGSEGAKKLLGQALDLDARAENGGLEDAEDRYALTIEEIAALDAALDGVKSQLTTNQILYVSKLTNRKFGNLLRLAKDKEGRITKTSMLQALARRPWNARLKTLCWKIGESFVKVSGHDEDFYGKLYLQRKQQEIERNEAGLFADQAAAALREKNFGKDTKARAAYETGKLPPARLHLRAQRYAVKIFLSHYHAVAYREAFGTLPPKPYVLEHLGHVHEIQVPNWPFADRALS